MGKKVGLITCGQCGNDKATVHEQERGKKKKKLYIRCYETEGGTVAMCGTIQCLGASGQDFIRRNIRDYDADYLASIGFIIDDMTPEPEQHEENLAQVMVEKSQPEPEKPTKKSWLDIFE